MLAPPIPHLPCRPPAAPRAQLVPAVLATEESTLETWLGLERQALPQRLTEPGSARTAAEEAAQDLLEGVRLLIAEESLFDLWEGCLRPKTAAASVIDCWRELLRVH